MKISVIGDIINDSLNEKELDIMRHFSRTELKAAINMLKEFTSKGNFAVLMYMGDTDKLEVSQTLNSDMSCFLLYGSIQPLAFFFAENIPMTAGELEDIINKQSAVYEEEMDNYRNALKESGADNGLFITKYESMIHTFIAYDPDQSGDRDCYAPFIEGAFNVEPGKGQFVNEVMRLEVYDDEYEDDCVIQKKYFVYLPSVKFMGTFNMRMMMSMVDAQYN